MYINELLYFKIVIGLVFVLFLLIYLFPKLNIRILSSSFQPFESSKDFFSYFKYSFNFIINNKYVLLFPLSFFIIDILYLIYIFGAAKWTSYSNVNYYGYLFQSIYHLDLAFYDFAKFYGLNVSIIIVVVAIIYLLIKRYVNIINRFHVAFILTTLILFICKLLPVFSSGEISSLNSIFTESILARYFYLLPIFEILLKSYLETFLLLYFTYSIRNYSVDLKVLINDVTKNVKFLILANLLISTPYLLISVVLRYMKINHLFQEYQSLFIAIYNSYLQPLSFLLQITLFLVPIIIVYNRLTLINSIKLNVEFINKNFIKFITFILFGIGLNLLSGLIEGLLIKLTGYNPFYEMFSIISLFFMLIFYIAFFKFYVDSQPKANQNPIV